MYLRKGAERSDLQPAAELVPVLHLPRLQHHLSSSVVDPFMNHPAGNEEDASNQARGSTAQPGKQEVVQL